MISLHFRELVACPGLVFFQQLCLLRSAVGAEIILTTPLDVFPLYFCMHCPLLRMSFGISVPLICSHGKMLWGCLWRCLDVNKLPWWWSTELAWVCAANKQCSWRLCRADQSPLSSAMPDICPGFSSQPSSKWLAGHHRMITAFKKKKSKQRRKPSAHCILDLLFLTNKLGGNTENKCLLMEVHRVQCS